MKYLFFILLIACSSLWMTVGCSKKQDNPAKSIDTTSTVSYIDTLSPSVLLKHPGGLCTQSDFDRIKGKVSLGAEPWMSGWNKLISNSHAQTTYLANPTTKIIRGGNSPEEPLPDNYGNAMNDAAAAFQLGIRWKITGDATYAQAAVNILNAWANTCTACSGDPNVSLAIGIYGYEFAIAGEQLRDYSGWAPADFANYQQWMLKVFYPGALAFLQNHDGCNTKFIWGNWDLCSMAAVMSIGILTDNRSMYNYVINYFQHGTGNGNIFNLIPVVYNDQGLAQWQESGRDQGHGTLELALLEVICQLAWNQGDDLWGFNDNMILKGSEYMAKYNVAFLEVPFTTVNYITDCQGDVGQLTSISSSSRGTVRPMWAMVYNHYVKIKGLTAQYTAMGVQTTQPEGGGGDYGSTSGGFDQFGFGTLLFSRD
ncbi:MAG TPA: alginate lyase family protein [Bacteroidales bacterium]